MAGIPKTFTISPPKAAITVTVRLAPIYRLRMNLAWFLLTIAAFVAPFTIEVLRNEDG